MKKIREIEESFRDTHLFATSETGAGIQEMEGEQSFQDIVGKKNPFYYELTDIMAERSPPEPRVTNMDTKEMNRFSADEEKEIEQLSDDNPLDTKRQSVVNSIGSSRPGTGKRPPKVSARVTDLWTIRQSDSLEMRAIIPN